MQGQPVGAVAGSSPNQVTSKSAVLAAAGFVLLVLDDVLLLPEVTTMRLLWLAAVGRKPMKSSLFILCLVQCPAKARDRLTLSWAKPHIGYI
jgi:hypothetical protein